MDAQDKNITGSWGVIVTPRVLQFNMTSTEHCIKQEHEWTQMQTDTSAAAARSGLTATAAAVVYGGGSMLARENVDIV